MQAGGRRSRGTDRVSVHGLIALGLGERLVDVRRKRRLPGRLAVELEDPPALPERLDELDGAEPLTGAEATRRAGERLPPPLAELSTSSTSTAAPDARRRCSRAGTTRVSFTTTSRSPTTSGRSENAACWTISRVPPVDEQPRRVARLDGPLRDELGRKVVVEDGGVHPALRVASPAMDALALERAKQRIADAAAGRPAPGAIEAALERSRDQIEALAATAAELEASIPAHVGAAVRDGLRTEVLPVARHIAEIRGLLNQAIRRLERLEGDLLAERHARVDDLALLVDLVSSGWRGVDARLARLESAHDVEASD